MTSNGFGWIAECVAPGRVGPALRSRLRTFDSFGVRGDGWMRVCVVGVGHELRSRLRTFDSFGFGGDGWMRVRMCRRRVGPEMRSRLRTFDSFGVGGGRTKTP